MVFRLCFAAALLLLLVLTACSPSSEAQLDEQKNPFFMAGKERVGAHDYPGAIEAFEKALETNPRSPLTHFELGVLYEQHSGQTENDFIAAMYHYLQVIRLRPNEYPADNARQRIAGCKQELVKGEALAPVAQNLIRENDRLKQENQQLRQQLSSVRTDLATRTPPPEALQKETRLTKENPERPTPARESPSSVSSSLATTAKPSARTTGSRTHTVRSRETAYAIAKRYGVSVTALLAANPRLDPNRMPVGHVLTIPNS